MEGHVSDLTLVLYGWPIGKNVRRFEKALVRRVVHGKLLQVKRKWLHSRKYLPMISVFNCCMKTPVYPIFPGDGWRNGVCHVVRRNMP